MIITINRQLKNERKALFYNRIREVNWPYDAETVIKGFEAMVDILNVYALSTAEKPAEAPYYDCIYACEDQEMLVSLQCLLYENEAWREMYVYKYFDRYLLDMIVLYFQTVFPNRISISATAAEKEPAYVRRFYTPERVTHLKDNQIFVFGSNLAGRHGGGAAHDAHRLFGAEWGVGVGPSGRCYAIPTMQGGADTIKPYVDDFISYAAQHPELEFLVTRIGCGIAGLPVSAIAALFRDALRYGNIVLPRDFVEALKC